MTEVTININIHAVIVSEKIKLDAPAVPNSNELLSKCHS